MDKETQKRVLSTILYLGLDETDYVNVMDKSRRPGGISKFVYCARTFIEEGYIIVKTKNDPNASILENREFEYLSMKGVDALDELQHPIRNWFSRNWFPFYIAVLTTSNVGFAAFIVALH